jgi:hypothetical protein
MELHPQIHRIKEVHKFSERTVLIRPKNGMIFKEYLKRSLIERKSAIA